LSAEAILADLGFRYIGGGPDAGEVGDGDQGFVDFVAELAGDDGDFRDFPGDRGGDDDLLLLSSGS
jgi:hypothetical protein